MPELVRSIMARLRGFIADRRWAKRRQVRLPLTVYLLRSARVNGSRLPSMDGHSLDLSSAGLSAVVPAIRIQDHYLAGGSQKLLIKLELPTAPVEMRVVSVRYERLDEDQDETGYLIGVNIEEMSEPDRSCYEEYLSLARK
jgi:hypothetical protein